MRTMTLRNVTYLNSIAKKYSRKMLDSPCHISFIPAVLCHWVCLWQVQHFYWEPRPLASVLQFTRQCLLPLHIPISYPRESTQLLERAGSTGNWNSHPSIFSPYFACPCTGHLALYAQRIDKEKGKIKPCSGNCQKAHRSCTRGFSEKYVQSLFQSCHQDDVTQL